MTLNEQEPAAAPSPQTGSELDWPLISAAAPLLPPGGGDAFLRAILGSVFRSVAVPAIYADLHALYLPGLLTLGIDAAAAPLTEALNVAAPLRPGTPRGTAVALYQFEGEPIPPEDHDADPATDQDAEAAARLADEDAKQTVVRAGLLRHVQDGAVVWEEADGTSHTESVDEFRTRFSRTVTLTPAGARTTRRAAVTSAVQRAVVFALAYPDRFVTDSPADAALREEAALLLREAAGKQRDPISLRWRQAAERFEDGCVSAALDRLYDAALRGLSLPAPVLKALSWPRDTLSNMERRELIYLARAGNRDLKVLAARRLEVERWAVSVRQTLEALKQFPDPLVRAAAKNALAADGADERR